MPSSSAAASANGLNVEPGWTRAWVASLRLPAVSPPYIAMTSPVPGSTADRPMCTPLRVARRALLAHGLHGRRCARLSKVVIDLEAAEVDLAVGEARSPELLADLSSR